jgi:hypothetical protein
LTTFGAIPRAEDARRVDLTMASVAEKVKQVIAEKLQIDAGQVTIEASIVEDLGADSLEQADILLARGRVRNHG